MDGPGKAKSATPSTRFSLAQSVLANFYHSFSLIVSKASGGVKTALNSKALPNDQVASRSSMLLLLLALLVLPLALHT